MELQEFDDLKKIIGQTKAMPKTNQVDINNQGLTGEEYEEKEKLEKKPKKELTEEEKRRLEELKKKTKNREAAISILRGISIRMSLLIYGAELDDEDDEITIDNFAEKIDPRSWEEFMPKGVSKQKFNAFKKYYDPDIFRARGEQAEVQRLQEILRPGHLPCGGQAHPRDGQGCGQVECGGAHRAHHGHLQYVPQSR